MNSNKIEDVKIKLSALWIAHFLIWTFGDILRFLHPGFIEEIIEKPISNMNLMFVALIGIAQAAMIIASIMLERKPNRWANMIMGAIFFLINIMYVVDLMFNRKPAWEYELAVVYLVFNLLTVWHAYKWPAQESEQVIRKTSLEFVPPT